MPTIKLFESWLADQTGQVNLVNEEGAVAGDPTADLQKASAATSNTAPEFYTAAQALNKSLLPSLKGLQVGKYQAVKGKAGLLVKIAKEEGQGGEVAAAFSFLVLPTGPDVNSGMIQRYSTRWTASSGALFNGEVFDGHGQSVNPAMATRINPKTSNPDKLSADINLGFGAQGAGLIHNEGDYGIGQLYSLLKFEVKGLTADQYLDMCAGAVSDFPNIAKKIGETQHNLYMNMNMMTADDTEFAAALNKKTGAAPANPTAEPVGAPTGTPVKA
jgi:hypothetical protein